jgi:hypothetical protein
MKRGEPDRRPAARRAEIGQLVPYPFNELFPLEEEARLQSPEALRGDVLRPLLAQVTALARTCHWALLTQEGQDNPQPVAETLLVLAQYLSRLQRIAGLIEEATAEEQR